MKKNVAAELLFLSDMSVEPDLGLAYEKKVRAWEDEDTSDDDKRKWFSDLDYALVNPDLSGAHEEFRQMTHYWNGFYTVSFAGKYISLYVSEDRIKLDGRYIIDYEFSNDTLTWNAGELHFALAMAGERPALAGKLVHGKLAEAGVMPQAANAYGSTLVLASGGESAPSNLKVHHFAGLDFFDGQYEILSLASESTASHPPAQLSVKLSKGAGVLQFDTPSGLKNLKIDCSRVIDKPQAGQNGRWNETAICFYDDESHYYGWIQFVVNLAATAAGEIKLVKGFLGAITQDAQQFDTFNCLGTQVQKTDSSRLKLAASTSDKSKTEEDANRSTVASAVISGLAIVAYLIISYIQSKGGKTMDRVLPEIRDQIRDQLGAIGNQLGEIKEKIPVYDLPDTVLEVQLELNRIEKEITDHKDRIQEKETRIAELERKITDNANKDQVLEDKLKDDKKKLEDSKAIHERKRDRKEQEKGKMEDIKKKQREHRKQILAM